MTDNERDWLLVVVICAAMICITMLFIFCSGCTLARQYRDDTGQSMAVAAYHIWHPDRNGDGMCDRFDEVRDEEKFRRYLQGG